MTLDKLAIILFMLLLAIIVILLVMSVIENEEKDKQMLDKMKKFDNGMKSKSKENR